MTDAQHLDGCTGKKAFATQRQAARRAKIMRREYNGQHVEYHCRYCSQWHIGEKADAGIKR